MAFCGHSGSGKTTLIKKLVKKLHGNFDVGFVKRDAHNFEMDHEGKDTQIIGKAGAKNVLIMNQQKWAMLGAGTTEENRLSLLPNDFVFIEGFKNSDCPRILVLDSDHEILNRISDPKDFFAIVGKQDSMSLPNYYQRDQVDQILSKTLNYFEERAEATPLYGLVLAGGQSRRMGTDKGAMLLEGKTLVERSFKTLSTVCSEVFISCRQEQGNEPHLYPYRKIFDTFLDWGPLSGLMSAHRAHPTASWLVMACDMPLVDQSLLLQLLNNRSHYKFATCLLHPETNLPEPLVCLYEPKAFPRLLHLAAAGTYSPSKLLQGNGIKRTKALDSQKFLNVNRERDWNQLSELMA
jgi:molybdopterin-guanine dinucleotide biosynthesis protein MobB